MSLRPKPILWENGNKKTLKQARLAVTKCKQWSVFFIGGLLCAVLATSITCSCVPVFSSSKGVVPNREDQASTGLIKPRLQEQGSPNSAPPENPKDTAKPSTQVNHGSGDRSESIWNRVFGVFSKTKSTPMVSTSSGLIKPKLGENPEARSDADKKEGHSTQVSPQKEDLQTLGAVSQSADDVDRASRSRRAEKGALDKTTTRDASEDARDRADGRRTKSNGGESFAGSTKDTKPDLVSSDDSSGQESQSAFKKHDHSKYVTMIRNKAIDALNKEPDCDVARLCRNSFTDHWSLTLYVKKGKYYTYTVYTWDEIDGNWVESYTSENRPVETLKKHISFSSAGKTCQTLKGSEYADSF